MIILPKNRLWALRSHLRHCGCLAAQALFVGSATAEGVDDFDQRVREALLRNPEIILEVFELLEQEQQASASLEDQRLIARDEAELFGEVPDNVPVLVEFFDYNCGYCRRARSELDALTSRLERLDVVLMQLPILGEPSLDLARLMLALEVLHGRQVYADVHHALMSSEGNPRAAFEEILVGLGLDAGVVVAASRTEEVDARLAAAQRLARGLGISGTPAFVTRHEIIRGFADAQALERAVLGR